MSRVLSTAAATFGDLFRDPRREKKGSPVVLGVLSIGLVAVVFLVSFMLPKLNYLSRTGLFHADFANASGLRAGDRVLVAGVPAGRVEDLAVVGGAARIGFRLDSGQPLGEASSAHIGISSILGNRFLEITPQGGGDLGPDRTIALARTTSPYTLDEIGDEVGNLSGGVDADAVGRLLDDLADVLPQDPGTTRAQLGDVTAAFSVLKQQSNDVDHVVRTTRDATSVLVSQEQGIRTLKDRALVIVGVLNDRRDALQTMIDNINRLSAELKPLLADKGSELRDVLSNLRSITETYENNRDKLDASLRDLPPSLRAVTDATGNGPWMDVGAASGPIPDALLCTLGVNQGCG